MSILGRLVRPLRRDHLLLLLLISCLALITKLVLVLNFSFLGDVSLAADAAAPVEHLRQPPDSAAPSGPEEEHHRLRQRRATDVESGSRTVYVVTPSYPRPEQEADLLRLAQTLMHAPFVFWVVVEDAARRTPAVTELLRRSGLRHVHLLGEAPPAVKSARFWGRVPRGVASRNTGLAWLRRNATDGVAYFADDDNTYDIRLFTEIQKTRRVAVFPVGLVTELGLSSPVVLGGRVTGFYDGWPGGRTFPIDMAGFAVSVTLLRQNPNAVMPYKAGYEEDGFLKALGVSPTDLEPLADDCSQILVWHTRTEKVSPPQTGDLSKFQGSNIELLVKHLSPMKA